MTDLSATAFGYPTSWFLECSALPQQYWRLPESSTSSKVPVLTYRLDTLGLSGFSFWQGYSGTGLLYSGKFDAKHALIEFGHLRTEYRLPDSGIPEAVGFQLAGDVPGIGLPSLACSIRCSSRGWKASNSKFNIESSHDSAAVRRSGTYINDLTTDALKSLPTYRMLLQIFYYLGH